MNKIKVLSMLLLACAVVIGAVGMAFIFVAVAFVDMDEFFSEHLEGAVNDLKAKKKESSNAD